MVAMYQYLICAAFAGFAVAQNSTEASSISSESASASSAASSASETASSASSVASSAESAATSASDAGSSSVASSLSSVASSASSVASSASSVVTSISSSISSVISSASFESSTSSIATTTLSTTSPIATSSLATSLDATSVISTPSVISSTETSSAAVLTPTTTPTPTPSSTSIGSVQSSTSTVPSSSTEIQSTPTPVPSSSSSDIELSSSLVSTSVSTSVPTSASISASASSSSSSSSASTSKSSSRSSETTSKTSTYVYSSVSSSVSYQETVYSTNSVIITTQADGQTSQSTQYTVIQTTIPATTVFGTTVVTSTESPTGIAGLQANADDPSSSSSLSTGTKAGIGAGVAVAVIAAAIIGAVYAMRRRRRHNAAIASHDSYTPSLGNSMNYGYAGAAVGKTTSRYTDSEIPSDGHSPPMRESNPLDRYTVPGAGAKRSSFPANSRTSDISSASGSEPTTYRPGPGMPAVAEQRSRSHFVEELPEQNNEYLHPRSNWPAGVGAAAVAPNGDPFQHREGGDTPSLYSNDGDRPGGHRDPSPAHPADRNGERQASPAVLELSGETGMNRSGSGGSTGGQGYRGMDPEVPYHSRGQTQLQKPQEGRRFDPSHNF